MKKIITGIQFALACCLLTSQSSVMGQAVLFIDRFKGPEPDSVWETALPNVIAALFLLAPLLVAAYAGTPRFGFEKLDGDTVIRLTNRMGPLQRRGWNSSTNFNARSLHYEVRFNSLDQSPTTSIDAFVEIWIFDATDSNRYDIAPYGGGFGTDLYFFAGSSLDNTYTHTAYRYQNNTWYRLVLEGAPGRNIRASLRNDDGTELIGSTLNHDPTAFGSGFRIALSQTIGASGVPYPVDVALDYAILMTAKSPPVIVVQPRDWQGEAVTNVSFYVTAAGSGPLKYQWYLGGRVLTGQTNDTVFLMQVRPSDRGIYSVRVSNQFGSTTSSAARLPVKPGWRFWR